MRRGFHQLSGRRAPRRLRDARHGKETADAVRSIAEPIVDAQERSAMAPRSPDTISRPHCDEKVRYEGRWACTATARRSTSSIGSPMNCGQGRPAWPRPVRERESRHVHQDMRIAASGGRIRRRAPERRRELRRSCEAIV